MFGWDSEAIGWAEQDLRQSAAETAAREAEDVVVAAQYEKEALDALAEV